MITNDLAILGGAPVRKKEFMSRPSIDEEERSLWAECLEKKTFSRFVGSPVGDWRRYLSMPSAEVSELNDYWSVLGGKYVRLFEKEFAKKHDVTYAVCMNSATSCLIAGLHALGIGPGDEVVTTPFSFTASATAIYITGATVRFADIDPKTFCITPDTVNEVITEKSRAIMPVHIMGNAGHVAELKDFCDKRGLVMIEDSAQALCSQSNGKILGTFGEIGVFSFQETKNIMTGEGGMAITDNATLAYKLRLIRNHGEAMVFEEDPEDVVKAGIGYNFRLPEPLAAIGYAQTKKIDYLNGIRRTNYYRLKDGLEIHPFIRAQRVTNDDDGFFPYCASFIYNSELTELSREVFVDALRAEGIPVATGFPRLMNENLIFKDNADMTPDALKVNNDNCIGFFQIGYPNTENDMDDIIVAVNKIVSKLDVLRNLNNLSHKTNFNSGRL